ncbi:MAG: adenylate/guanylate cyclase domain-containing protein [Phycisphaeraceae bacterium]
MLSASHFALTQAAAGDPSQHLPYVIAVMAAMLILAPAMCVSLWILWRRRSGEQDGGGDPVCGACRYPVRGLSTFQCPECGADLREVGMLRPRGRGSFRAAVIAWTIMWPSLMILTMGALEATGVRDLEQYVAPILIWGILAWFAGLVYMLSRSAGAAMPVTASPSAPAASPSAPFASAAITRNLSIMFIDVEDFTGLAAKETRDGLLVVIRKARDLVKPVIERHHGKLVKTMGDGFLVTFDSPTDAVLCGRAVQSEASRRAGEEGDKALRFRIGITTGEVALENDDVYGDPVNLASRLQTLAPPGDVYFSESTYHAMTRSEVPHETAGEFEVKGVAQPVRVYRTVPTA